MEAHPPVAEVFVAVILVVVLARLLARGFRSIRQPAVIGEMLAGILLGASLLGQFEHGGKSLTEVVFPTEVRPFLSVLANLGLVFFMFIVGMELDLRLVKGNERIAVAVSVCSVLLPFGLGALLALQLYDNHSSVDGMPVDRTAFVLFIGASMSVTAFPVLARILGDRGMSRTPLGVLALACAAVDDVIAWTLLALVAAVAAQSSGLMSDVPPLEQVALFSVLYVTVMFTVVRRLLRRIVPLYEKAGRLTPDVLAFLLVGLLLSAWITEEIGIHFVFGAFVFGACLPREGTEGLFQQVLERLEQLSVLLLLPVFFIVTGLNVDITSFQRSTAGELALVLLVAVASKFFGAFLAASALGVPRRRASALGLLMNTRGLTELVLLSVGRELGVLDTQMFSMLVVMALVTTFMTAPLVNAVYPDRILLREIAEAERLALGGPDSYRVLVVVDDVVQGRAQLQAALDIVGAQLPAEILLVRFRPQGQPTAPELGSGLPADLVELSAMLDEMHELESVAAGRGVGVVPLTRYSVDPTRDVAQQAGVHDVDLVLVPEHGSVVDVDRLVSTVGVTVATWDGVAGVLDEPVLAVVTGEREGEAAMAVAVRMASGRDVPLVLLPARDGRRAGPGRLSSLTQRLARAGVDVQEQPFDPDTSGTLVLPRGSPVEPLDIPSRARVRVVGSQERLDSELTLLLQARTAHDTV